jgi:hypothetical protein
MRSLAQNSTDREIREALHRKLFKRYHKDPNTLVIDELGLAHGKHRIDVAVLNGCIHGYEIKSSKDKLTRLPQQFSEYRRSLEKLSIVAAPNHIDDLLEKAPSWCGLVLAEKGAKGALNFSTLRFAKRNPDAEFNSVAHLLWRNEAIELLHRLGAGEDKLKGSKKKLYENLSELISLRELSTYVRQFLMGRDTWRVDLQLSQYDGSPPPVSR